MSLLVAHNILVHRKLDPPVDSALNLLSAGVLTALAKRAGCTQEELGLERARVGSGVRYGIVSAACSSAVIGALASHRSTRALFIHPRIERMSRREVWLNATLRIPFATALGEEIIFRSALHGLFARERGVGRTLVWTSLLFGLWHILPTIDDLEGNPVLNIAEDLPTDRTIATIGNVGATALAGFLFSLLRLRSGNVVAPILTHASINIAALMAGRVLGARRVRSESGSRAA